MDEIHNLLDNFLQHFNSWGNGVSPLIQLAVLHYQFESIHPFYDGNGRTGRILNILHLILNDLIDIPILYLSSYIIENKRAYYKLLNAVHATDQWEDWIIYMLNGIEETAKDTIERINQIHSLMSDTVDIVKAKSPKIYSKELVELIFENPYSQIDHVVKGLGVERKAPSRYLKSLEKVGVLKSQKI